MTKASLLLTVAAAGASLLLPAAPAAAITPGGYVIYGVQGDANADYLVDIDDFVALRNGFGEPMPGWGEGDFDFDGEVTIDDFVLLKNNFGKIFILNDWLAEISGDWNCDGDIDLDDFVIIKGFTYGTRILVPECWTPGPWPGPILEQTAGDAVPEPATAALLAAGGAALIRRRR